ncbi:MAG: DUF2066 domain-containing protein [Aeromonas sp.]
MLKHIVTTLCCGLSFMVCAAQITELYQGKAPLSSNIATAQAQALAQVLQKITGNREILTQPAVIKALATPGDYVKSYDYQDLDSVKYLTAEFNSDSVNRLITDSQFALLGSARPQVAVWLVVEQGDRHLLADQSSDGWAKALREQAQLLGLPISIPLMDLDDSMVVSTADVLGGFAAPILQASKRYGAKLVVLGKVVPEGDQWSMEWGLYGANGNGAMAKLVGSSRSGTQAALAQGFANSLGAWLVKNYGATSSGPTSSQTLVVDGLADMGSMIAVQKLLHGMANVSKVEIGQVAGDQVTFHFTLQGEPAELQHVLQLEPRLQRIDDNGGSLRYHWSQP